MKDLKIEKQKASTVLITGELPWEDFKQYRQKALKKLSELVSVDGFRKGHIPEDILIKKVGEVSILEEMASMAFQVIYPKIIIENKISAIGRPSIQITKLASENPLGFSITTAVLPEVKLPDYKKIAKNANASLTKEDVTEEEVQKTIDEIRMMKARQDLFKKMQDGTAPKSEIENNKEETIEEVQKRIDEKLELPEFDEAFVKTLGEFEGIDDFKAKLKENLAFEKERRSADKNRLDIIDAILKDINLELPEIMVEAEVDQLVHSIKGDVARMGMTFEAYLESASKTEDDIRTEVKPDAEKRAAVQVIVAAIAREEKIFPEPELVKKEIEHLKSHYPEASEESLQSYVETVLANDLVFKFLESQK